MFRDYLVQETGMFVNADTSGIRDYGQPLRPGPGQRSIDNTIDDLWADVLTPTHKLDKQQDYFSAEESQPIVPARRSRFVQLATLLFRPTA